MGRRHLSPKQARSPAPLALSPRSHGGCSRRRHPSHFHHPSCSNAPPFILSCHSATIQGGPLGPDHPPEDNFFFSTMIQHPILNRLVYGGHQPRPTSYSYHPFDNITLFIISTETTTPTSQLYSTFRLQVAAKLFTFSAPCSHNNHLPFSAPSSHTSQSQFTLFMGAIVLSSVFFESRYLFP